ncbi:MAG: efflux transporter outer membrane subunit [Thermodesulfobacteriota bacterium]
MLSESTGASPKHVFCLGPALLIILSVAVLTGCMVGPNFQRPQPQIPEGWAGPTPAVPPEATLSERELARWWTLFGDDTLSSLVERAVSSNLDLKLAEARIRQARAARGIVAADIGPSVDAAGSFERFQTPGSSSSTTSKVRDTTGPTTNQYRAGFDASWELDIFGGVRRGIEAADADLEAAVEDRRDVLVTLTAEVARNYLDLRAFQQRVDTARQNLKAQQRSAELTRQRFRGGFVSGLDVANAEAQVATTAAEIPILETFLQQTLYSIAILLGREPGALLAELSTASRIPAAPPSVPLGVPSDLIRRRPDIRRAEAQIHASTARIGVATADLFPRINILGSGGFQSAETGTWFESVSRFWSLGPSLRWPVFDTGRIRANIEQRKALEEQSILAYQRTILVALQEVENALIASAKEQEHRKALADAVLANQKAVKLATILYTEGQTDFLNVLQAQRSLYASEDAMVQSSRNVCTNLVALYKALGGGWGYETTGERPQPDRPGSM